MTRSLLVPVGVFEAVVNKAMEVAMNAFNARGELVPSVDIIRFEKQGEEIVAQGMPLNGAHRYFGYDGGKDDLAIVLQRLYELAGEGSSVGALIVHEAWLRLAKIDQPLLDLSVPPSMAPDRQEALVCSLNMSNGENYTHFLIVDPATRRVAFEPFSVATGIAVGTTRFSAAPPPPSDGDEAPDEAPTAPVLH